MTSPNARRSTRLGVEALETRDVPAALLLGGIVPGSIAARGEVDTWTFPATAGQKFQIIHTSTPWSGQSGFKAQLDVYSPTNQFWGTINPGSNFGLNIPSDETGTWVLKARDDNRTERGDYAIGLERTTPNSPDAVPLTLGGIVPGSISAVTEKDQWTFTAAVGQKYQIIHTSAPWSGQSGFKAQIDVYSPTGDFWGTINPGGTFTIDVPADEAGKWVLQVRDDNFAQRGNYAIGLERIVTNSPDAKPLTVGGIVAGSVAAPIEKDQWIFWGTAGQKWQILHTSTPAAGQSGFKAQIDVFAPTGEFWGTMNPGGQFNLDVPSDETGKWVLQVRDDNLTEKGNYAIGLERIIVNSPDAKPLTVGGTVAGSIAAPIEKDQWTFSAAAGQRYEIVTTSTPGVNQSGFKAVIDVYSPTGQYWGTINPGQTFAFDIPADQAGKWVLQVRDDNFTQSGNYTIQLTRTQ